MVRRASLTDEEEAEVLFISLIFALSFSNDHYYINKLSDLIRRHQIFGFQNDPFIPSFDCRSVMSLRNIFHHMFKTIFIAGIFLPAQSQDRYADVDAHALATPEAIERSVTSLSQYLTIHSLGVTVF